MLLAPENVDHDVYQQIFSCFLSARHGCSLCTPFSHGFSGTAPSFVGPRVVTPYHVAWQDILDGVE